MAGAWSVNRFASWYTTTKDPKQTLMEEAKNALNTNHNSSGIRPGLAIIHNEDLKRRGKHILSLPGPILAAIARKTVVSDKVIIVSASDPSLCEEPALLNVCKDLRAIVLPVYYRENRFCCAVSAFNVVALQPWTRKREMFMQQTINFTKLIRLDKSVYTNLSWKEKKSYQGDAICFTIDNIDGREAPDNPEPTALTWSVDDMPNWNNLMDWLELYHANDIGAYRRPEPAAAEHYILSSLFGLVRVLRAQPWEEVVEVLKEARAGLSAVEPAWGVNHVIEESEADDAVEDSETEDEDFYQ